MFKKQFSRTSRKCGLILLLSSFFLFVSSCQKQEDLAPPKQPKAETAFSSSMQTEGKIKLGKKLENPYSVTNMRKALESLRATDPNARKAAENLEIKATNYYVRFFVRSIEAIEQLEADSLHLYDHPLDYEVISQGTEYVDPTVNPAEGKWYYTSVSADYSFPTNIEYEILENLFLTDERTDKATNARKASTSFLHKLEDEALRITDNWEEPIKEDAQSNARRAKRHPDGYVRVFDTERRRLVGVEAVRVRTRRWFHFGYAWTTSSGHYRVNRSYRRPVHYTVFFDNSSGFKITKTIVAISKAKYYAGKHNRNGHDINLYTNSKAWRFATVNNAVAKYRRFCKQFDVGLPAHNLRIAVLNYGRGGAAPMLRRTWGKFGFTSKSTLKTFLLKYNGISLRLNQIAAMLKFVQPDLVIKVGTRNTRAIYNLTFHELAHASHHRKAGNRYWVKYINYIVSYGAYGDGSGKNAGVCGVGEMWGYYFDAVCTASEYGTSVEDELNRARSRRYWFNPPFLNDVANIPDMSVGRIYSCLDGNTDTLDKLRTNLQTKTRHDRQIQIAWNRYTNWP